MAREKGGKGQWGVLLRCGSWAWRRGDARHAARRRDTLECWRPIVKTEEEVLPQHSLLVVTLVHIGCHMHIHCDVSSNQTLTIGDR